MCNVMRWHWASHLLKVAVVTEQHDVTNIQLWVYAAESTRKHWLLSFPLQSFTPSHTLTSSALSHLDVVPMATHQPSIWVVSQCMAEREMTGYEKWMYIITAITCYCTVWWPSLFSLCLSLCLSFLTLPLIILLFLTFYLFSSVYLLLFTLFFSCVILNYLLPDTPPCIFCSCTCCLHFSFVFISLSVAILWRCSDLQPSLDRVRSASTTCLRPDTNFHSPDRDRYKKELNTREPKHYMNRVNRH